MERNAFAKAIEQDTSDQDSVQMEGIVHDWRPFGKNVSANCFEIHIVKLHVEESLLVGNGPRPHIDPLKWRPLFMTFCRFFGMGGEVHPSRLAESDFMKIMLNGNSDQPSTAAPVVSVNPAAAATHGANKKS